ncbi:uncharacterized protein [Manis javanica]|uniref:uncharacterized protein n=1 Tax=Manis javanica TaxID=9974 RepID=UPI003C6CD99C
MSEGGKGTGNGKREAGPTSQALPCPEVIQFSFETRVATFGPWPIHRAVAMLTGRLPAGGAVPSAAARAPGLRVAPAPSPTCPAGAASGSRGREGTRPAAPGPPSSAARSHGCSLRAPRGDPAALLERVGQVYQGVSEGEWVECSHHSECFSDCCLMNLDVMAAFCAPKTRINKVCLPQVSRKPTQTSLDDEAIIRDADEDSWS